MKQTEIVQNSSSLELSDESFIQLDPYLTQIGFFSVEEKGRVRALSKSLTVNIKGSPVRVELNALGKYDLPRTQDLDKYLAFAKLLYQLRRHGELVNPIPLLSYDLLREIKWKSKYNDYEYKSVKDWLGRLRSTEIICESVAGSDAPEVGLMTSVFHRVLFRGDKYDNEIVKTNLIWMDELLLKKFNESDIMPLDYEGYKLLKRPTAKNLVPLLSKWLYSARNQERFEKNYDNLSDLLGVIKCRHKSDIKKQLFPALDELTQHGWIEKFDIERNNRDGFKICIKHGARFEKILSYHEARKSFVVVPGNDYQNPSGHKASAPELKLVEPKSSGKNRQTGKSRFSYDQWLEYARTQSDLKNPTGYADKAFLTGEKDHILEFVQAEKSKLQKKEQDSLSTEELKMIMIFCPQCYGSGSEVIPNKGAKPCDHSKLTIEKLMDACNEGELPAELVARYRQLKSL